MASDSSEMNRILAEVDISGWTVLIDPMESLLDKIHQDGSAEALLQIGVEDQKHLTSLLNERSLTYAEDRSAELVGMTNAGTKESPEWVPNENANWAITDSTREMIRGDVATAIDEGWSPQHLANQLAENNPAFSDYRAEMIARTEIRKADVEGNMVAYVASGIVQGKEWIIGSEHDDDDECTENAEAGVIPLDESFPSGDDAAPAHPNCICDVLPVLIEEHDGGGSPGGESEAD
jgi:hypothetical protein